MLQILMLKGVYGTEPQSRACPIPFGFLQACSFLNCIVDWRPMDDPVLSGVTQICVTKLEGEVMIHVSIVLIHHGLIVLHFREEHTL